MNLQNGLFCEEIDFHDAIWLKLVELKFVVEKAMFHFRERKCSDADNNCTVDHCEHIDAVQLANDLVMDYFWMGTINKNSQINKTVLKDRNIGLITDVDLLLKKK